MVRFFCLLLLVPTCFFRAGPAGAGNATTLDFIYVDANTGEAAGGHTALKMGSTVFHFQFFPEGRFLLVRDSWSHFRYVYNELRNRSIFIASLPLTPRVYTQLKEHFTGLLISQQQNLDSLQDAVDQLRLLTQLASGADQLELETVGLFGRDRAEDADMRSLQQVILEQLGESALQQMQEQVDQRLASLATEPGRQTSGISWAASLRELLLEREFYRIVEEGNSLAPDVVIALPAGPSDLTPEELKVLAAFREKLAGSIVRLLQSSRPDRARALMLQAARYLVVSRSLSTATLLTLDPFSLRAVPVQVEQGDDLQRLYGQQQQDTARARKEFFSETVYPDIAYTMLETSRGRLAALGGAVFQGKPVRVESGILLPGRKGEVSLSGLSFAPSGLAALISENEAKVLQLREQLDTQYAYNLIDRNCATELLRSLNSAFPDRENGRRELAGWLEPDNGLVFIPNQLYAQVIEHFPVQEKKTLPSRRLRQLEDLYGDGNTLSVRLRESNTLSSTLYAPRTEDTPFLFFTDDALLLRPVMGITNLCWAAVNSLGGVFTLPLDGGERIHQGVRGMFYSLPELVFSNIRKGTYGFAATAGP